VATLAGTVAVQTDTGEQSCSFSVSSSGNVTEPSVTLYRAVDSNELADLRATGRFNTVAGQMEVKEFWINQTDALWFAGQRNLPYIVEAIIPQSMFNQLFQMTLDGRPAAVVYADQLDAFNAVVTIVLP